MMGYGSNTCLTCQMPEFHSQHYKIEQNKTAYLVAVSMGLALACLGVYVEGSVKIWNILNMEIRRGDTEAHWEIVSPTQTCWRQPIGQLEPEHCLTVSGWGEVSWIPCIGMYWTVAQRSCTEWIRLHGEGDLVSWILKSYLTFKMVELM